MLIAEKLIAIKSGNFDEGTSFKIYWRNQKSTVTTTKDK